MNEKKMIVIQNPDGTTMEVEQLTYLIREDNTGVYLVYSKGEKVGEADDEIIYISRIVGDGSTYHIEEIVDDNEWKEVQGLLKKIANAQ